MAKDDRLNVSDNISDKSFASNNSKLMSSPKWNFNTVQPVKHVDSVKGLFKGGMGVEPVKVIRPSSS